MKILQRSLLIALILSSCIGCDQITKNLARRSLANSEPMTFLHDIFRLEYLENPGAFLSLGASSPANTRFWIFTFCTGIFLIGMLIYLMASSVNSRAKTISLTLVVGGGIGNLIDRIGNQGRVIDFMNLGIGSLRTGVFNVADVTLSLGIAWFFIISYQESRDQLN